MKKPRKKILITGGGGYVGAVLTEKLVKKGLDVKIFDKFYFGEKPISHLNGKIEVVKGDIRRMPENLFDGVSSIVHLAGLSNDPTAEFNPEANREINTVATINLAEKARLSGVKRFVFASSCSIYDLGIEHENGVKTEESYVRPKAPYSLSKYQAEQQLLELAHKKFCVVIFRKGTIHGFSRRMRYDLVVNTMIKNAIATGAIKVFCGGVQWRPIVDVEDVAEAYYKALLTPARKINKQIINISLDNYQIRDLAEKVRKVLKEIFYINSKIIFEQENKKDRSYRVSNTKAEEVLNFKPEIPLEESIVKIVENINEHGFKDFTNPIYYNIEWMKPIFEKEARR